VKIVTGTGTLPKQCYFINVFNLLLNLTHKNSTVFLFMFDILHVKRYFINIFKEDGGQVGTAT
jgi:hypothetical protein